MPSIHDRLSSMLCTICRGCTDTLPRVSCSSSSAPLPEDDARSSIPVGLEIGTPIADRERTWSSVVLWDLGSCRPPCPGASSSGSWSGGPSQWDCSLVAWEWYSQFGHFSQARLEPNPLLFPPTDLDSTLGFFHHWSEAIGVTLLSVQLGNGHYLHCQCGRPLPLGCSSCTHTG